MDAMKIVQWLCGLWMRDSDDSDRRRPGPWPLAPGRAVLIGTVIYPARLSASAQPSRTLPFLTATDGLWPEVWWLF